MPVLGTQTDENVMVQSQIDGGRFKYSAVRPEALGAAEYTLVTILVDVTGSVAGFENELRKAIIDAVEACKYSPRADNLLVRVVLFNTGISEIHGFKMLRQIDPAVEYKPFDCADMTALFDASRSVIVATNDYAKTLVQNDFDCNGIIFIITDGEDNRSRCKLIDVASAINDVKRDESMESLLIILVGVNAQHASKWLDNFHKKANLSQYVNIEDFDDKKGAKLAAFISKSTSSQSNAIGTGGASQVLGF